MAKGYCNVVLQFLVSLAYYCNYIALQRPPAKHLTYLWNCLPDLLDCSEQSVSTGKEMIIAKRHHPIRNTVEPLMEFLFCVYLSIFYNDFKLNCQHVIVVMYFCKQSWNLILGLGGPIFLELWHKNLFRI